MEIEKEKIKSEVKDRTSSVRIRTWTLTLALIIVLIFYILLQFVFNQEINVVSLIIISAIGITVHCIYFPDGELYGQKNKTYIQNKKAYNQKATTINKHRKIKELREYLVVDYELRKQKYIENEIGALGLEMDEYLEIKEKLTPKQARSLTEFECKGKIIYFTKKARSRLKKLLFRALPVQMNDINTIMSACESNYTLSIRDTSIKYKTWAYIKKCVIAVCIGVFFAYVSYSFQDGITLEKIASLIFYLASMFATAILSYSKGEVCQRVYKNKFYVDLSNFIDSFFEWLYREKNDEITEIQFDD